jgi:hypothetical protein
MSDTSGSSFTRGISGAERILQTGGEGQRLGGRLVRTTADLIDQRASEDNKGNRRLSGEVVEERKDRKGRITHVKIRTPRGDIEVEREGTKPLPRKGQKIEIEIKASQNTLRGGESLIIRTENTARIAASETVNTAEQIPVSPRVNTTPVNVQIDTAGAQPPNLLTPDTVDTVHVQQPAADVQALMHSGVTLRITPVDVQTLAQNVKTDFYTVPMTLSAPMPEVFSGGGMAFLDPAGFDVPVFQTAINFMHARGKGADAAHILGEPLSLLKPPTPDLPRLNAQLLQTTDALPKLPNVQVNTAQLLQTDALLLTGGTAKSSDASFLIPEAVLSSQEVNVRIGSIAPPLALPTSPLIPEEGQTHLPVDKLPFVPVEQTGLLTQLRAGEIHAVITGQTGDKLPTMSVFFARADTGQVFTLHAPVDSLVPGTQVTLTPLIDQTVAMQGAQTLPPLPFSVFIQASPQWSSLQDLTQVLNIQTAQVAQTLSNITPHPVNPAQFSPALMLFVAAVRGGDFSTWLGDKVMDGLRRSGRGDIMRRIGQEASLLARSGSGPVSGDWQGVNIPLYHEGQFQKAALYWREYTEKEAEDTGGGKLKYTRFIFDLSLSNMGGVQVDGLLRRERLDVILRTEKQLSAEMQRDMRRLYTQAIGQTDFTGELSFQNDPRHWVNITPDERHIGVEA